MTHTNFRNGFLGLLALALPAVPLSPALAEEGSDQVSSAPAKATVMDLKYEVYAGGMLALVVKMETALGAENYRTLFKAEIAGPYSWFMDFAVKSQVEGMRDNNALQPATFVTESYKKDKLKRRVEISYLDDGTLLTSVDPEPKKENRDEIPPDMQLGTFDPLSAVLLLTQAAAFQGNCDSLVPVFDGRRRFDLTAEDLGSERIDSSRYQAFEGDARHCLVKFERLTGHKKGEMGVESSYPDNISVFLGQVEPGLPFVPVRMEMDHKYGALRAHLVDVDISEEPIAQEVFRKDAD